MITLPEGWTVKIVAAKPLETILLGRQKNGSGALCNIILIVLERGDERRHWVRYREI